MSFNSWLQNLRSARASGGDRYKRRRRTSIRAATHRLNFQALEDRCLLSFSPPVSYAAGSSPVAVATADFNGDSRLDLAVANNFSNTLSVLPGNGDGSFEPAQNYDIGYNPRSAAVGDFNADGNLDLVTANQSSGDVSVLLGNGDGSFQPARSVPTSGSSPLAVAVGDFNADGTMDLAVTGFNPATPGYWGYWGYYPGTPPTSEVTVLLGEGDGTFAASNAHDLFGDYAPSVATGDFNDDQKADLAWADQSATAVSVLLGNGDGTFAPQAQSFVTDFGPNVVVGADLNNDNKLDLVTANGNNSASVLLSNGDGTFQAAQNYVIGGYPSSVGVADVTGDGKPDLLTANPGANSVGVLPGNGDGSFRGAEFSSAGSGANTVAAGDFNGDGRLDLAVADYVDAVSVMLNTGDWRTFLVSGLTSTTAGAPQSFTVTALDRDGNLLSGYTGAVHFTSSDAQAVLPADYAFTAADHGTHTFTVTLKTAGAQSVSATDRGPTAFSGTQGNITVNPAAASSFQVSGVPSPLFVGDSREFTAAAYDAYGNVVNNYAGTVHFASSDGLASLPADFTFTAYDYGRGYFSAVLNTVGSQSITVSDTANPAITGSQTGIHVNPLVTVSGQDGGLRNQTFTLSLGTTSGLPANTVFTYAIDWNGDGVVDQTLTGPNGTMVNHSYATTGTYYVGVTAAVDLGADVYTSYAASRSMQIFAVTATVQADPGDATRSALTIQGTADADSLVLSPGAGNAIALSVGGYSVGSFSAPGGASFAHVLVYGNGGGDTIQLAGNLSVPALLFGGDGNDTLDASGSTANNALIGGAGNDTLFAGIGRDLLIGGSGADTLRAGNGGTLLIGGYTDYDANVAALLAVIKEWGRTDADYNTRLKHLNGSLGGGLNGSYRLTKTTVHDDNTIDSLYGGAALDWFFVGNGKTKDRLFGQTSSEVVTTV